jgi:hypothetical protein
MQELAATRAIRHFVKVKCESYNYKVATMLHIQKNFTEWLTVLKFSPRRSKTSHVCP